VSAKKITVKGWLCRCELLDCPGKGQTWVSHKVDPPRACRFCKRTTWNGTPDRRFKTGKADRRGYLRTKQAESRARRKKEVL